MSVFTCDCCHKQVDGERHPIMLFADNGTPVSGYVCDMCRIEHTAICLGCWHRVLLSDAHPHPNGVNHLCHRCYKGLPKNDHVLGYEEEHKVILDPCGRGKKFVGFELEYMCHTCINTEVINDYGDKDVCRDCDNCLIATNVFTRLKLLGLLRYAKSTLDSTVTGEVVTAPMTIPFLFSPKGVDILKEITDVISDCGGFDTPSACSPCTNVGGHIHVSREFVNKNKQDLVADVLAKLTYATKVFWHKLSGRKKMSTYAVYSGRHEHLCAINFTPHTYEFRFWAGSLDPEVWRARAIICTRLLEYLNSVPKKLLDDVLCLNPEDSKFHELMYESILQPFFKWLKLLPYSVPAVSYIRNQYKETAPRDCPADILDMAFDSYMLKEFCYAEA